MVTSAHRGADGDGQPRKRARLPAAQRRESILRAAAEVFAQSGYRAAKVSDVAARVGVTEPVIFQNFGSKAALFAAVLERAAAEVRASLDDLTAASGSASGLLAHVLNQSAHERPGPAGTHPAGRPDTEHAGAAYGVLFADAAVLAAEPGLAEPARSALRTVAGHLADLIHRAQADSGVRADIDPEAAAWLVLSVLSARRLRGAAMPAGLEPAVTALTLRALVPATTPAPVGDQAAPRLAGRAHQQDQEQRARCEQNEKRHSGPVDDHQGGGSRQHRDAGGGDPPAMTGVMTGVALEREMQVAQAMQRSHEASLREFAATRVRGRTSDPRPGWPAGRGSPGHTSASLR